MLMRAKRGGAVECSEAHHKERTTTNNRQDINDTKIGVEHMEEWVNGRDDG